MRVKVVDTTYMLLWGRYCLGRANSEAGAWRLLESGKRSTHYHGHESHDGKHLYFLDDRDGHVCVGPWDPRIAEIGGLLG